MSTTQNTKSHGQEIRDGERFAFGENWTRFLSVIDEERIKQAEESLKLMLEANNLNGKSFLDIGSGSGLSSLAARRLGAIVVSFDYDPQSVVCTKELKRRFFENDEDWTVEEGSALDIDYLKRLGKFDIVYSWGVLHQTGDMWRALNNVSMNVAENGKLFISLYNDQGGISKRWHMIKRIYNFLPAPLNSIFSIIIYFPTELRSFLVYSIRGTPHQCFSYIINYKKNRGMSWWYDKIDWIGGFPFEVSKPEEIFEFYKSLGYELKKLKTCGRWHGCNEYVFQRKT